MLVGFSRILHNRGEAVESMEDVGERAVSDISQVADCFAKRACLSFFERGSCGIVVGAFGHWGVFWYCSWSL